MYFRFLGQTGMSSWLDTFSNKKMNVAVEKNTEITKNDSSSLDSRLSNLLQNIPNLPSGLQSTIFGNVSSGNNTPLHDSVNSPICGKKDSSITTGSTTPIKDEYSGQNTPLQDEESTHSSHAFFQKMTSTHKSKDMLKGLTSLIQSVSNDKTVDDVQKKDKYGYGSVESFDQGGGMSSFIKKIIPSAPQASHSSVTSFYNSTQSNLSAPIQTVPIAQTSTVSTYETASFHDVPVYSSKPTAERSEHMSFIPTLVPSMPQDSFSYDSYAPNEYNPELETFDTDMEVQHPISDDLDEQSPTVDSLSPVPSASDEMPRSIGNRRLSTLITVVTKDSPENSLPTDDYKSDKENLTQDENWMNADPAKEDPWTKNASAQRSVESSSPNEEFFIGKEPAVPQFYTSLPPPPIDCGPPNGQSVNYINPTNPPPVNLPLSNIETVQIPRDDMNGQWSGNNWVEPNRRPIPPPPGPPPMPCGMQEARYYNRSNFHPPNYAPRNNWGPRHRYDKPFHRPYGPYQNNQNNRFPYRGRGRGRQYSHF